MGLKSLRDAKDLVLEIANLKKKAPELKDFAENLDYHNDPTGSLEKVLEFARENPVLDDLLKVTKTFDVVKRAEKSVDELGWAQACQNALKEFGVNYEVRGAENIRSNGPALYITNHPYGLLDGAIIIGVLGDILGKMNRNMKIIGTHKLKIIKGIEKVICFVDTPPDEFKVVHTESNIGSLRNALRHLKNGGDLVLYPAGSMSGPKLRDAPWNNSLGRFASRADYVIPMWFSGPNHEKIYNTLARYKKTDSWKNLLSFREAWNKEGETVVLKIGKPIDTDYLKEMGNNGQVTEYLRREAEKLKVKIPRSERYAHY